MDYQNYDTNVNKGNSKIIMLIVVALLVCIVIAVGPFVYSFIKNKVVPNNVKQDAAYSIISSVELAHRTAFLNLNGENKEFITIEDIRKEYSNNSSIWNEDNTIISNDYDFVCNVTVNSSNEIIVGCDVNGKIIESESLSLKVQTNSENDQNNNTNEGQNNQTNNNKEDNSNNVISYKIDKEYDEYGLSLDVLYVNNRLVDFELPINNVSVKQLNDILIVESSVHGSHSIYAVDKNANVIGVFSNATTDLYKETSVIPIRANYWGEYYEVKGNNLYIQTNIFGNGGPHPIVCNNNVSDDRIVVYEEKFEYLGDNKFGSPIVTKSITKKQYIKEHNITCSNNQTNSDEYVEWMDYLLTTDIQKITISKNNDYVLDITVNELKQSLKQIKKHKLKKAYVTGLGGFQRDVLYIPYNVKGQTYHFSIASGGSMIIPTKLDSGLIEALDRSVSEVENEQYKNNKNYTCIYYLEPTVTSVFDDYFDK